MDVKKPQSGYEQEPRTIHIDGIMASYCSAEGGRYKGVARYVAFEREVPSVKDGDIVILDFARGGGSTSHAAYAVLHYSKPKIILIPMGKSIVAHYAINMGERQIPYIFTDLTVFGRVIEPGSTIELRLSTDKRSMEVVF